MAAHCRLREAQLICQQRDADADLLRRAGDLVREMRLRPGQPAQDRLPRVMGQRLGLFDARFYSDII